jgi:hypothetical protein
MKKCLTAALLMLPLIALAARPGLPPQWEAVTSPNGEYMYRLAIPQGWIFYTYLGGMVSPTTTFIPDPRHEWTTENTTA